MTIHYRDYKWKEGIPYGINKGTAVGTTYKIPMDPYRKWISIEEYLDGAFIRVVYDSRFLDFRHLKPEHQQAWEKLALSETLSEIRSQDDRLLFREEYTYEGRLCRSCRIFSASGHLLAIHRMYYESLGDAFNGVILTDITERRVLTKRYEIDEEGLFSTLLEESTGIKAAVI